MYGFWSDICFVVNLSPAKIEQYFVPCNAAQQLTLPAKDDRLPGEKGVGFSAGNRWFDFSNATVPWPEYQGLASESDVCLPEAKAGGLSAFEYEGM